jgi:hypothetical protein
VRCEAKRRGVLARRSITCASVVAEASGSLPLSREKAGPAARPEPAVGQVGRRKASFLRRPVGAQPRKLTPGAVVAAGWRHEPAAKRDRLAQTRAVVLGRERAVGVLIVHPRSPPRREVAGAARRGPGCLEDGQVADAPGTVVVLLLEPPLGVAAALLDQRVGELGREEHVAEQLAAGTVAGRVEQSSQQH